MLPRLSQVVHLNIKKPTYYGQFICNKGIVYVVVDAAKFKWPYKASKLVK